MPIPKAARRMNGHWLVEQPPFEPDIGKRPDLATLPDQCLG